MGDCGQVKWIGSHDYHMNLNDVATKASNPKYSFLSERLRSVTPAALQCSVFCGGRQCKYCNPVARFKKEDMVIDGLYSSWVTDNILATSRPSTEAIKQYDIIKQFHSNGITSIINLQHGGEHMACGFGLEPSGFSYEPEEFMTNNIFFYNFGWNDYGVRSLQSILDMVQVMDFALANGKAAVHCHAGLGRTGVLIACYIIFSKRCSATEAIYKVRQSRPRSIQTRGQINCVKDFAAYIKPMWVMFSDDYSQISLQHFLNRQRRMLHGEERKTFKYIPKILFIVFQRLLDLASVNYDLTTCVKVTHYSFMKRGSVTTPTSTNETSSKDSIETPKNNKTNNETDENEPESNLNNLLELSQSEADCSQQLTEEDLLYLRKENTEILASSTTSDDLAIQITKAVSMPNVALGPSTDDNPITLAPPRNLKPLKKLKLRRKKRELRKKLLSNLNGDSESLASSFNSCIDPSEYSLSASLSIDTSFRREASMISETSLLSDSINNGLSVSGEVIKYLAFRSADINVCNQIDRYKHKLNTSSDAWDELRSETNLPVLSGLVWSWLKCLTGPIVTTQQIDIMKSHFDNPQNAEEDLPKAIWKLILAYVTCISKLDGRPEDVNRALRRFAVALTGDELIPRIKFSRPKEENELTGNETHGQIFFKFLLSFLEKLKER